MHVGASPHDDTRAHVADHAGCEDGAIDDSQDRRLDWRSEAQSEVSLEVRWHVEVRGRVEWRHVVSFRDWRHRCASPEVCNRKLVVAKDELIWWRMGPRSRPVVSQQSKARLKDCRDRSP